MELASWGPSLLLVAWKKYEQQISDSQTTLAPLWFSSPNSPSPLNWTALVLTYSPFPPIAIVLSSCLRRVPRSILVARNTWNYWYHLQKIHWNHHPAASATSSTSYCAFLVFLRVPGVLRVISGRLVTPRTGTGCLCRITYDRPARTAARCHLHSFQSCRLSLNLCQNKAFL